MARPATGSKIIRLELQGDAWVKSEHDLGEEKVLSMIQTLPTKCYVFLQKDGYPPQGEDRDAILKYFGVPLIVGSRACTELNGYFGYKASYGDSQPKEVTDCSTWARCLVKMVRKEPLEPYDNDPEYVVSKEDRKSGYVWFEMGIFTSWNKDTCRVLCVDTPYDLPDRLKSAIERRSSALKFQDPFAMHTDLVDQVILYYELSAWRVRDPVRNWEKTRERFRENTFRVMHEISRHAIQTAEVLTVMIETLSELQRCQEEMHKGLPANLKNYSEHAKAYATFQIQLVKNLKHRSESNQKRLENEVNLAFNNLAHQDNTVMKSIALLTMVFLPATFLSSLFSTTFFTYGEIGWVTSPRFWVYWAIAAPVTVLVVIIYVLVLFFGRILSFFKNLRDSEVVGS